MLPRHPCAINHGRIIAKDSKGKVEGVGFGSGIRAVLTEHNV